MGKHLLWRRGSGYNYGEITKVTGKAQGHIHSQRPLLGREGWRSNEDMGGCVDVEGTDAIEQRSLLEGLYLKVRNNKE